MMSLTQIDDLTHEELCSLTDEQVSTYINRSAAAAGVPIPGEEPPPFTEQKPSPDLILYTVAGTTWKDRDKAEELQRFLLERQGDMFTTDYNYNVGYHARYVKGYEGDVAISEDTCYSAERYASLRADLEGWGQRQKNSESARSEWKKLDSEYQKSADWVWNVVRRARDEEAERKANQQRFDEYLLIAEGDARLAWEFFEKAGMVKEGFRPDGAPEVPLAEN